MQTRLPLFRLEFLVRASLKVSPPPPLNRCVMTVREITRPHTHTHFLGAVVAAAEKQNETRNIHFEFLIIISLALRASLIKIGEADMQIHKTTGEMNLRRDGKLFRTQSRRHLTNAAAAGALRISMIQISHGAPFARLKQSNKTNNSTHSLLRKLFNCFCKSSQGHVRYVRAFKATNREERRRTKIVLVEINFLCLRL
jgi:hypothetical protein